MIDVELILKQCRKNNRQAQADLYNHLAPKLLGLCLRYLRDRNEAEDVMQDAFVKIFTSVHTFKGEGSFEGWARRIAVNTALDALKSRNRIQFERNLELVKSIDFTEEEQQHIGLEELMACMDALPTGYRTIINLFLVEGFTHREIGEKLGISESTSRSQCVRARQALMKLIKARTDATIAKNA